ncbi:conjugative transposon protein TraN [Hymenobacter sp. J193]|uniref:conjugative transposon protein TraN n=1 Tax=Hymenobacter sp. J193 TaxID=2898429 RepID=UPI0021507C5C|nr:conjugative transposon protein TraN [Hymenobacter sp. J193]MCR5890707.1 conjugative transposon protein TraN [Hymenobacter sp. J193]
MVVANETLLDVAVSDSSTTYLVFGGPVSLVDVGMANNYLVKIEANAVFVRAKRKNAPPTPMLIRYGSKYWMGRLVFVNRPVLQLYDFQKDGALGMSGTGTAAGSAPENELALDKEEEKKSRVEGKLSQLRKAKEEHQAVAVVDNDLVLSLANVRNDKDFTYLRFKVINKTNIDYNVDFTDFQLVENAQRKFLARKKNEARRPLAPSGGLANQIITGRTTGYLTYAIPLYAATERGYLEVTLRELNGARVLVLPVPSRVINRASTI